ncbi:MAG: hypothetical protein HY084_08035 [Gemmatimonadetes bacterium]|nr:hypothetical protein [Gemmatimonadota bacterium]
MTHPSVARIVAVVRDLGPLAADVVFIGGAVAPLLHTASPLPRPRPTKDVDGVLASHRYDDANALHEALRARGFQHDTTETAHLHRWQAPSGVLFDLVPAGAHPGGNGNVWDAEALASAVVATVNGVAFRHVAAPAFIAMKLAAYTDRGGDDLRASHDIEDIMALIASRPTLVTETAVASVAVRARLVAFATTLLANGLAEDVAAAHLNNADDPPTVIRATLSQIAALATL